MQMMVNKVSGGRQAEDRKLDVNKEIMLRSGDIPINPETNPDASTCTVLNNQLTII